MTKTTPLPNIDYINLSKRLCAREPLIAFECGRALDGNEDAIRFIDRVLAGRPELLEFQPTIHWTDADGREWGEDVPGGSNGLTAAMRKGASLLADGNTSSIYVSLSSRLSFLYTPKNGTFRHVG